MAIHSAYPTQLKPENSRKTKERKERERSQARAYFNMNFKLEVSCPIQNIL